MLGEQLECMLRAKKETMGEFLTEAIGCSTPCKPDSEGRGGANVQHLVAAKLRDMGLAPQVWIPPVGSIREKYQTMGYDLNYENRPNVTAVWGGTGKGRSLVLNCHVDVGSVGELHDWSGDPFMARIAGDNVFGRGACDAKGPLTAVLFALETLRDCGFVPGGNVYFQSVADQIGGGNGTLACIEAGHLGDAVIVAQPTALQVCSGSRGFCFLTIRVRGQGAHAGSPGDGVNAITKAVKYVTALRLLQENLDEGRTHPLWTSVKVKHPMTVTAIRGGGFGGVVPNECEIRVNAGYTAGETREDLRSWVTEAMNEVTSGDPWLTENPPEIIWEPVRVDPSVTDPHHPFVRMVLESKPDNQRGPTATTLTAISDLRFFTNMGIPGVIFGPGDLRRVYLPDEYVSLDEVVAAALAICRTILRWTHS